MPIFQQNWKWGCQFSSKIGSLMAKLSGNWQRRRRQHRGCGGLSKSPRSMWPGRCALKSGDFPAQQLHATATLKCCVRLRRVFETRLNILAREFREVAQDFVGAHAIRQRAEDVVDGDARAFYARFSAAFVRRDFEMVLVGHRFGIDAGAPLYHITAVSPRRRQRSNDSTTVTGSPSQQRLRPKRRWRTISNRLYAARQSL